MSIIRWRPAVSNTGITKFGDVFDRFFENSLLPQWENEFSLRNWAPSVDIYEEETEIVLKAEVPGLSKEDITVEVNEGLLTIKGEKKEEKEEKEKTYYRTERRYGSFQRSFYLPEGVNTEEIKASYKKGVLELRIPKVVEEKKEARKIEVATD